MPSERVQRQIDGLLDEAEDALKALKWDIVKERALAVVALDDGNQDAQVYLKAANARLGIATAPAVAKDPLPLETCQIEYTTSSSFLGRPRGDYYFWAKAASPVSGQHAAGCSPSFNLGVRQFFRNWAYKRWMTRIPSPGMRMPSGRILPS